MRTFDPTKKMNNHIATGGNFALVGRPSVGASGAIVGTLAVLWVDLMAHWKLEDRPWIKVHIFTLRSYSKLIEA